MGVRQTRLRRAGPGGASKGRACDASKGRACDAAKGRACDAVKGRACDAVMGRACDAVMGRACDAVKGRACDAVMGRACDAVMGRACDAVKGRPCVNGENMRPGEGGTRAVGAARITPVPTVHRSAVCGRWIAAVRLLRVRVGPGHDGCHRRLMIRHIFSHRVAGGAGRHGQRGGHHKPGQRRAPG